MRTQSIDRVGALVAIGLHALAGAALLAFEPARSALYAAAPIMVSLVTPPRVETQPEAVVTPAVKPEFKQPDPPPVLAAPLEAPAPDPVFVAPPPPEPAPPPPPAPAPVAIAPPPPIVVTPPVFDAAYLRNPQPAYPQTSIRFREQGRVRLRVRVSAAGTAEEVQIHVSSGHPRLDEAARDTVQGWRFVPASRGDVPIVAWVHVPISFALD